MKTLQTIFVIVLVIWAGSRVYVEYNKEYNKPESDEPYYRLYIVNDSMRVIDGLTDKTIYVESLNSGSKLANAVLTDNE